MASPPTTTGDEKDVAPPAEEEHALRSAKIAEWTQVITLCWTLFLAGWNDGTLGPLIPRIQEHYKVGYTVVSLLFVLQCAGCLVGALCNIPLTPRIGFGKLVVVGSVLQTIAYAVQASAPPFPAFLVANFINGVGISIQDAQANGYVASMPSNAASGGARMALVQAAYGAGALVAPLVSTQFARDMFRAHNRWAWHYLISVGVTVVNAVVLVVVFRGKRQDECLVRIGQVPSQTSSAETAHNAETDKSHFRQILALKSVHLLALFLFVYVGTEVTIGGWIVSFMISVRHGGPSAGYVSAGFFGGLTIGRLILLPVNKLVGEHRAVYLYGILCIGLELIIWLVPSLHAGAVAVSLVGFFLGPIYPIAMNTAARIFPPVLLTGIIGFVAGVATAGAAVVPFVTGAIAGVGGRGVGALQPVVLAMLVVMLASWALVPRSRVTGLGQ